MNTGIVIAVLGVLALSVLILPTSVYAQDAYSKGYKDALCDAVACTGQHGYDPSCPGDHSSEYCNNYRDGYAAGWASANANNDGQEQNNAPPPQQPQDQGQGQSQSQSQSQGGITNNNNPTIIINPK